MIAIIFTNHFVETLWNWLAESWFLIDFRASASRLRVTEALCSQTEHFEETFAVCASIHDPQKEEVTNVETLGACECYVPPDSSALFMIAMHADFFR
jgi:hypothetical protein